MTLQYIKDPTPLRVCVRAHCGRPAKYRRRQDADDLLCEACACYLGGAHAANATRDREALSGVIIALRASEFAIDAIKAMVDGELEGKHRPFGPDNAHKNDPRPWVREVVEPLE